MQEREKNTYSVQRMSCGQKHATDKAKGYIDHKAPASSYTIGP